LKRFHATYGFLIYRYIFYICGKNPQDDPHGHIFKLSDMHLVSWSSHFNYGIHRPFSHIVNQVVASSP